MFITTFMSKVCPFVQSLSTHCPVADLDIEKYSCNSEQDCTQQCPVVHVCPYVSVYVQIKNWTLNCIYLYIIVYLYTVYICQHRDVDSDTFCWTMPCTTVYIPMHINAHNPCRVQNCASNLPMWPVLF